LGGLSREVQRIEAFKLVHKRDKRVVKLAEEYLEAVYEIYMTKGGRVKPVDVAKALNVAPSTVKKVIERLCEKGYVRYERYRTLELTEEGMATVEGLKRRHDSISKLFQTLGMDELSAEVEAERLEHQLSENSMKYLEALDQVLNEDKELLNHVREGIRQKLEAAQA